MKLNYIFVIMFVIIICTPYAKTPNPNKGDMRLVGSIPYVNSFRIEPENEETKINTGFFGIATGLDYYHSENQFVNFGVSGVIDFFLPVPAAVDPAWIDGEEDEFLSSLYFVLSNNHRIKIFTVGYGLSYAINYWSYSYYNYSKTPDLPPTKHIKKNHGALGLIFSSYIYLENTVGVGFVYRPTFFRPGLTDKFLYEHLISIEFPVKLTLINTKKTNFSR